MNPRKFLNALFDVALKKAHPKVCLPPYLAKNKFCGRTFVFGAGKAAAAMAQIVEYELSGKIEGLVVTRYNYTVPCINIEVIEAGHPIPDNNGMLAASKMLKIAYGLQEKDTVLFLISGGGSSLLSLPAEGLSLKDKKEITSELLNSGATIHEINIVRKHISAIKGGRLALACYPAKVITLAISDVVGDDLGIIASGPTIEDPSTFLDAKNILNKYKISKPKSVLDYIINARNETPKPGDYRLKNVENILIASAKQSLEASAKFAEEFGIEPLILSDSVQGESRVIGKNHAILAKNFQKKMAKNSKPLVILSGGETCVTVKGNGVGGPNTEYLLSMLIELRKHKGIWAIACDTDGIDGFGDNAGAFIGPDSLEISKSFGLNPKKFLSKNDSYNFFLKIQSLISPGPTLTNVNDFRAILIFPKGKQKIFD